MTCMSIFPFVNSTSNTYSFQEDLSSRFVDNISLKGQATRLKINPALFSLDPRKSPFAQHWYKDKISDAKRSANITQSVGLLSAYPLAPLRATGPQGWLASLLIVTVVSLPFIAYANTVDQYNDLIQFAATGEIDGYSVIGETHDY
tara:strand:- start:2497 stop:2934 length:438 start_codon:yes stop_codon:yes gene_type:complete